MKFKACLFAVSALALMGVAVPASAQSMFGESETYASLGYTHYQIDDVPDLNGGSTELDFGAATGRFGAKFGRYFGGEAELQVGVNDAEENIGGVNVSAGVNYSASVFAVAFLPLTPNADLFARLGVGVTEVEVEASGFGTTFSQSESGSSVAYGVGGQYFFDDFNGLRADYTRFDGEDDASVADALTLSYVRKF